MHWIHCIENVFTVQHFWATCTCPETQTLPWNFSLYWIFFLHSWFLSNLRLPWKTEFALNSLYWICIFYHSQFLSNLLLPWKNRVCPENFHCIEYIFYHSGFLSNFALALKNRVFPEIFPCIEYTFHIQDFWVTCAYPEKQSVPWIHCFEYIFFIIQEFLATCTCPEKQSLPWNFPSRGRGCRSPASYTYVSYSSEPVLRLDHQILLKSPLPLTLRAGPVPVFIWFMLLFLIISYVSHHPCTSQGPNSNIRCECQSHVTSDGKTTRHVQQWKPTSLSALSKWQLPENLQKDISTIQYMQ